MPMNIYCVAEGKINTIERNLEGKENLVASFTPSQIFPLSHVAMDHSTDFEFVAEGKARLCLFPVKTVRELLPLDPNLSMMFLRSSCQRSLDNYERILILQSKSASEKVLRTLHQFKDDTGLCRVTRKEISLWCNLTVETVIRTLTSLEKKKRIRKGPEGIQIMPPAVTLPLHGLKERTL